MSLVQYLKYNGYENILELATEALEEKVLNLYDDPEGYRSDNEISDFYKKEIAVLQSLATDLGLDWNDIIEQTSDYERERIANLLWLESR